MGAPKVYLAARYSRRRELAHCRNVLRAVGVEVTSTWLDGDHQIADDGEPIGEDGEALIEGTDQGAAQLREHFAREDVADVKRADIFVAFTEEPRTTTSRGGRHVELGIAIALGKRIAIVGPRENLFCWLPEIIHFDEWAQCARWLHGIALIRKADR